MPTYSYRCRRCAARFELFLPVSRRGEAVCPRCGASADELEAVPAWEGAVVSAAARPAGAETTCSENVCPSCPGSENGCGLDWD